MDIEQIITRVKTTVIRALGLDIAPSEIDSDASLFGGDVGLNSLATIEIIVALEEEFDIEVPDEDLRVELFDSVRAMADYVAAALGSVPVSREEAKAAP